MDINKLINENTYVIADSHFCDYRMTKYEPSRVSFADSSSVDDIDNAMIDAWNNLIGENDVVLHLGDYAFKNIDRITKTLNGIKILLRGNHDPKSTDTYIRAGFDYVIEAPHFELNGKVYKDFQNNERFNACYIKDICDRKIMFTHFPLYGAKDGDFQDIKSSLESIYEDFNCDINIHGHTHSRHMNNDFNINVCVENIDFKPIQLKELLS